MNLLSYYFTFRVYLTAVFIFITALLVNVRAYVVAEFVVKVSLHYDNFSYLI